MLYYRCNISYVSPYIFSLLQTERRLWNELAPIVILIDHFTAEAKGKFQFSNKKKISLDAFSLFHRLFFLSQLNYLVATGNQTQDPRIHKHLATERWQQANKQTLQFCIYTVKGSVLW